MIAGNTYTLVVDLAVPGVSNVDVVVSVKKPTGTTFESVPLDLVTDVIEGEYNYYNITIPASFINELGTYVFKVSSYEVYKFIEKEALPLPLASLPKPGVCVVTGNIRNLSGAFNAKSNAIVTAQPLKLPLNVQGSMILGEKVSTYTTSEGFFSLSLIIGMTALIEIPESGVRFQALIPDLPTTRIEALIP